jgi:hypothetical protein
MQRRSLLAAAPALGLSIAGNRGWAQTTPKPMMVSSGGTTGTYSLLSGQKVNNSNWLLSSAPSNRSGVAKIADWIGIFSNTVTEKTCSNV